MNAVKLFFLHSRQQIYSWRFLYVIFHHDHNRFSALQELIRPRFSNLRTDSSIDIHPSLEISVCISAITTPMSARVKMNWCALLIETLTLHEFDYVLWHQSFSLWPSCFFLCLFLLSLHLERAGTILSCTIPRVRVIPAYFVLVHSRHIIHLNSVPRLLHILLTQNFIACSSLQIF